MSSNPKEALVYLRLIAALAEKLAQDIERGALWEGDYQAAVSQISKALRDMPDGR